MRMFSLQRKLLCPKNVCKINSYDVKNVKIESYMPTDNFSLFSVFSILMPGEHEHSGLPC